MKKRKISKKSNKTLEKLSRISKKHSDVEFDENELEKIERRLKGHLKDRPLTRNFYRNILKGILGAVISLLIFYIFFYQDKLFFYFDAVKIIVLLFTGFLICSALVYLKKDIYVHKTIFVFPKKAFIIYFCSLLIIFLVTFIVEKNLVDTIKQLALISILTAIFSGIFNFLIHEE